MVRQRVAAAMEEIVPTMHAPGVAWALVHGRRQQIDVGAAGPLRRNTIARVASLTKPIVAVLTLGLVDDGLIALDEPVDRWLPQFGDRRVLRAHGAPLDDTVPADRPTTVRDLLQMGVGWGFDAQAGTDDPLQRAIERSEIGSGWLPTPVRPDRWAELAGALPMAHQPGEGWLYQYSFDALAVLLERVTRRRLGRALHERVFSRLDMTATGYSVAMRDVDRVPATWFANRSGRWVEGAPIADPRLMSVPVFRSGATGLLSTAEDLAKFARMLLLRGRGPRGPVISEASWEALRTDTLGPAARTMMQAFVEDDTMGWGLGVGVDLAARYPASTAGRFGWDGGTGTTMWVDPGAGTAGVLLTRQGLGAPDSMAPAEAFWAAVHADAT